MNEQDNSIFKNIENIHNFNLEKDDYLGFIIDSDTTFLLPQNNYGEYIHHDDSLKLTLVKLYKEEKEQYFSEFKTKIQQLIPDNICFLDSPELLYSFFLASLSKIVFLNSSSGLFTSGLLFIPEQKESLSIYQQKNLELLLDMIPNYEYTVLEYQNLGKNTKVIYKRLFSFKIRKIHYVGFSFFVTIFWENIAYFYYLFRSIAV